MGMAGSSAIVILPIFVSSFTSFWDSADGVIDTVPAIVVTCFVAGADCVHPAQSIKPAIRMPDRM
jgi:hypothetical protein